MFLQVGILGVLMSILSKKGVFVACEGTIEQVRDSYQADNASLDILNVGLDMAFGHVSPQKSGTLLLNRKYVTSDTVWAITDAQLDLEPSCTGLLIMASCPVASVLSEMASEMKLLHLLFSPGILPCHIHSRYLVNLASSEETFIQHIQNIVRYGLRWRQVLLIHDDLLHWRAKNMFKIALSKASVKFKVLRLENISMEAELAPVIPMMEKVHGTLLFLRASILNSFMEVEHSKEGPRIVMGCLQDHIGTYTPNLPH
ncbi:hypothetical protein EGW08_014177 [Elysia chlorotica]|uniref:Receptor ligand binding region domain-containing protein n=1 Tax=Elysia chlorotica TaxID=188477 RepID=A0A433T8Z7_ELYCH|nr:hypothetical protein EGW08_014177 [Elysia chlorotica]